MRFTSISITPMLETSSMAASMATFVQVGPDTSAVSASGAGKSTAPIMAVRPRPMAREIRGASAAPANPPSAPNPKAMPIAPADRSSSRLA